LCKSNNSVGMPSQIQSLSGSIAYLFLGEWIRGIRMLLRSIKQFEYLPQEEYFYEGSQLELGAFISIPRFDNTSIISDKLGIIRAL
jgi:hypothetical protein